MKKLLSLLLVLAMTISLAVPMVSAEEFTDVDTKHQYYNAIQSLVARGIVNGMGDGTFAPDADVTRAQYAKMVVLSIGITNAGESVEESGFPDVPSTHWAAGFVKAAHGQGIINGFEDGTFRPEEKVTYEQAITMAIRAKSLFLKAEAEKIGYPDGYIQLATKYKFLKGIVDGVNKQPAKRGTIAQLMDNMLKVELSDDIGGIPQIEPDNMEEVRGQILAVRGTSLIDGDTDSLNTYQFKLLQSDGYTAIYDAKNLSMKDNLRSYLGKQVIVYYEEDDSARVQVATSMSEQRNRNYEVTVTLDQIEDYTNTQVEYDDNDDIEKIVALDNAIIMYNGSLTSSDLDTLITNNLGRAGSIRFLCSEGDGAPADVIFFTSYTNWYVTSTTSSSKTVYGEIGDVKSSIVIDDEARNKTVTITKDGRAVSFSSIAKGQILSISKSDDEKVIDVMISSDTVSGTVTAKDDVLNTITVQSKKYTFNDGLDVSGINLGVTLKLYLDAFGKVAKYTHQMTSTNYVYGYLLKASNDGSSMDGKVALKILKLNTTSVTTPAQVYMAETVTINNRNYKPGDDANEIIALLKETAQYYEGSGDYNFGSDEVFQPIRYSTGGDGTVTSLYIGTQAVEATESDLKVDKSFADSAITYTGNNTFQYLYKLTSATKVVYIPNNDLDRTDNNKYIIRNGNNASLIQGANYKIVMVDLNASSTPAVVLMYSSSANVASAEWEDCVPMLVKSRSRGSGAYPYEVTLLSNTGETVYYDEGGAFYNAVVPGDVVRVSAASDNKVEEYEIVAEASEIYAGTEYIKPITHLTEVTRQVDKTGTPIAGTYPMHSEGDRNVTRKIVMFAGVALDIADGSMKIVLDYPEALDAWTEGGLAATGNLRNINVSGAKVVAVEFRNGNVDDINDIDIEQIQVYDDVQEAAHKMFVYCYGDSARLIVVYRDKQ